MPLWSCDKVFEVMNVHDKFVVDLDRRICSCGKWRISGLPCRHSISCMHYLNIDKHFYVSDYFKKSAYMECYKHSVLPLNGPNFWPSIQSTQILPPIRRKAPGRPKKRRNKDYNEERSQTKMSRQYGTITCSKCGIVGHNKKSCT
ncbi:hypothetical protein KSP39_PZI001628 [Platanthera zijinensis]